MDVGARRPLLRYPVRHRFTEADFDRMAEVGILYEGRGLELIDGDILEMSPENDRHAEVLDRLAALLYRALAGRAELQVRIMHPLVQMAPHWQPQPDFVIQRGSLRHRPTSQEAVLVIEVADTTVRFDGRVKLPAYARAGIPEVWLIDLTRDELVMYRNPEGGTHRQVWARGRGEQVTPEVIVGVTLSLDEILGPLESE
jgi:Uma2 family endonuclease